MKNQSTCVALVPTLSSERNFMPERHNATWEIAMASGPQPVCCSQLRGGGEGSVDSSSVVNQEVA